MLTLSQALSEHGITSRECDKPSSRQLVLDGADVGQPIDASSGWVLAHMLEQNGLPDDLAAAIDIAIDVAAGRESLCPICATDSDGCYCRYDAEVAP